MVDKSALTEENSKNLCDEVGDILKTISAVKGRAYAETLKAIFGLCNFHTALEIVADVMQEPFKEPFTMLLQGHDTIVNDIIRTLAAQHVKITGGPFNSELAAREAIKNFYDSLDKDILMLSNKQKEYQAFVIDGGKNAAF